MVMSLWNRQLPQDAPGGETTIRQRDAAVNCLRRQLADQASNTSRACLFRRLIEAIFSADFDDVPGGERG